MDISGKYDGVVANIEASTGKILHNQKFPMEVSCTRGIIRGSPNFPVYLVISGNVYLQRHGGTQQVLPQEPYSKGSIITMIFDSSKNDKKATLCFIREGKKSVRCSSCYTSNINLEEFKSNTIIIEKDRDGLRAFRMAVSLFYGSSVEIISAKSL